MEQQSGFRAAAAAAAAPKFGALFYLVLTDVIGNEARCQKNGTFFFASGIGGCLCDAKPKLVLLAKRLKQFQVPDVSTFVQSGLPFEVELIYIHGCMEF